MLASKRVKLFHSIYFSTAVRRELLFCRTAQKLCVNALTIGSNMSEDNCQTMPESDNNQNQKIRRNPLDIQMLSRALHKQIFKCCGSGANQDNSVGVVDQDKLAACVDHLKEHGLWGKESSVLPDVDFHIPKLHGNNLDEHFKNIALQQCEIYLNLAKTLCSSSLPKMPSKWTFATGWTKYDSHGSSIIVDFPEEKALVFDVEVLVNEGSLPVLATAVSPTAWYSWCSGHLIEDRLALAQRLSLSNLIPLETKSGQIKPPNEAWEERIVIGHNVSFDRAFIKEQYLVKGSKTRFMDTMSLHIATSGLTGLQRALLIADETGSRRKEVVEAKARTRGPPVKDWMKVSCLNNLADVYKLYCKGPPLQKATRDIFVKGSVNDVRQDFQNLMRYCADDVKATHGIFKVLLPLFLKRFPHPVTLAGMLEMSTAYLPVNHNWQAYIEEAQSVYDDLEKELKIMLMRLANDACELLHDCRYMNDPWLWDLDWSVKEMKTKAALSLPKKKTSSKVEKNELPNAKQDESLVQCKYRTNPEVENILHTVDYLYARRPHLAGYPAWYRELCPKYSLENKHRTPGPTLISSQMQVTPKLLRLTWDGYPLHYTRKNGWGYIVPGRPVYSVSANYQDFPLEELVKICPQLQSKHKESEAQSEINLDTLWNEIVEGVADPSEESQLWNLVLGKKEQQGKLQKGKDALEIQPNFHHGNGPYLDEDIPGCWFFRLPHKDGPENKVGNPLAKDFLNKIEDGTLKSNAGEHADWALKMNKMISYWKNAHKRITSQSVIWLKKGELPRSVFRSIAYDEEGQYGCILPKIITAGTVTRRAVEPTWLTASNAYVDRVGSELKAMVQAFPGYHFVGADVDSQELWIASILGDAYFAGLHGCTALGWMTLQGKKSSGTDMHSKTASKVGITRDQAKVMNYGRIYGAGQPFASRLLMQFNHRLTAEEAKSRAQVMYAATKGVRGYVLNKQGKHLLEEISTKERTKICQPSSLSSPALDYKAQILTRNELYKLLRDSRSGLQFQDVVERSVWVGGTESAMFNKLEEIAVSPEPKTPVLGCKISRALEPAYVLDNFMTSRVNWVVQSSAVDYLHLMLVAMRWLFDTYGIDGRFCISIHDEVRYLIKSEDRYRAALALQITNLLTRCMFAFKLGMNDLPQSVAFFSTVDIDTVLRKEVHLDCKTPSNVHGLEKSYGIQQGEALDIYNILKITNGRLSKV